MSAGTTFDGIQQAPPIDFVCTVKPRRTHPRLIAQQGVFLCQGNLEKSFAENLRGFAPYGIHDNVMKIMIPHEWRKEIMADLRLMNITRASLFPGLDGFAQSLKSQLASELSEEYLGDLWEADLGDESRWGAALSELQDLHQLPQGMKQELLVELLRARGVKLAARFKASHAEGAPSPQRSNTFREKAS